MKKTLGCCWFVVGFHQSDVKTKRKHRRRFFVLSESVYNGEILEISPRQTKFMAWPTIVTAAKTNEPETAEKKFGYNYSNVEPICGKCQLVEAAHRVCDVAMSFVC